MDFDFNEIKIDCKECIAEKDSVISTTIPENDSGGVNKILSVVARGRIVNIDANDGVAKCFGRINFKLLYLDANDDIKGIDYFADFTENISIDTLSIALCGLISVIDSDVEINGDINLSCMAHISLFAVNSESIAPLNKTDDSVYSESKSVSYMHLVKSDKFTFKVSADYDTHTDVQKILLTDVSCNVERVTAGMGNILFSGAVNGIVTYKVDDKIYIEKFSTPFSEEQETEGVEIGDIVDATPTIKNTKVTLSGVEGSNTIKLENDVEICYRVFEKTSNDIITDVFSVEKELITTTQNVKIPVYQNPLFLKGEVSAIAEIKEDAPAVLEVIGITTNKNIVAKGYFGESFITEGIYSATILYRDEDGLSSIDVEIPYSLPFDIESSEECCVIGCVLKNDCKLKRAREIEVTAELGFYISCTNNEDITYISKIEEGAEKERNMSAVSVYIADNGETIYDVAKALSARPDEINAQNPTITSPYKKGDKLFFFRGISFEF